MKIQAVLFCLILSATAEAALLAPASDATWGFDFLVIASDGVTSLGDSFVESQFQHVSPAGVSHDVEMIGTRGLLDPMVAMAGDVTVSIPGSTYASPAMGRYSQRTMSITFTTIEAHISGDPIALGPCCRIDTESLAVFGSLHVAGIWNFGTDAIPFDATVATVGTSQGDNVDGPSFRFSIGGTPYQPMIPMPTFSDAGVDYTGRLSVRAGAFVPEPSTAALVAFGLVALAWRKR